MAYLVKHKTKGFLKVLPSGTVTFNQNKEHATNYTKKEAAKLAADHKAEAVKNE